MASKPARKSGTFTYSDYVTWTGEERWELVGGHAWAMSPSPGRDHQRTVVRFAARFESHFEGTRCQVIVAPFDVVLSERDVVQPDVLVVCDPGRITPTHLAGAPDLIVEILSPSTATKDLREKLDLYEKHGVREYLVVHLEERVIQQHVLGADGCYGRPLAIGDDETWKSTAFPGLHAEVAQLLAPPAIAAAM